MEIPVWLKRIIPSVLTIALGSGCLPQPAEATQVTPTVTPLMQVFEGNGVLPNDYPAE